MPKYTVGGLDKVTGQAKTLLIDAQTVSDAVTIAGGQGCEAKTVKATLDVNPSNAVDLVIDHFCELPEREVANIEAMAAGYFEDYMGSSTRALAPEGYLALVRSNIHILYALRVSKVIDTVTSLQTLASRWRVAWGAGVFHGSDRNVTGLFFADKLPIRDKALRFLWAKYAERFAALAWTEVESAESKAKARKSPTAKRNIYVRAASRIANAKYEITGCCGCKSLPYDLPPLDDRLAFLHQLADAADPEYADPDAEYVDDDEWY
jgi:hypothetical protein